MGVGYEHTEGKIPTHSLFGMDWRFLDSRLGSVIGKVIGYEQQLS